MIKFSNTIADDEPQIQEWMLADPYHSSRADVMSDGWWLTGADCLFAGAVDDESGPVLYFRFDKEEDLARMHCQFPPAEQVNKRRVAQAISESMIAVEILMGQQGLKGIVYESTSPNLIKFMSRLGFTPRPGGKEYLDDYVLLFEEK